MHFSALDVEALQGAVDVFHLVFLAGKDDGAGEVAGFEDMLDDAQLLRLIAYVGCLLDFLGRFAHGYLHFNGIFEHRGGKFLNLGGHRGREHDYLASLRQLFENGENIVAETHIEHAVGLVEHEERHAAEVHFAQTEMADKPSGGSYHHIGAQSQRLHLLVVTVAVVASIDGHAAYILQIIAESLHGLVDLLRQFSCGTHDNTVDCLVGEAAVGQSAEYGQEVSGRLAGTCLGNAHDVVAVEYLGNTFLLNGCARIEVHVVECIEHVVV